MIIILSDVMQQLMSSALWCAVSC